MSGDAKALRQFHNFVKSDLIKRATKMVSNAVSILDIGVGRGGDIMKWYNNGVSQVVGVDIEIAYIKEAIRRYNNMKIKQDVDYRFYVIQNNDDFITALKRKDMLREYDIVSCQFCLHYFASSEEMMHETLKNVSKVLKPGGVFIGTVPNGERIHQLGSSQRYESSQLLILKIYNGEPHGFGDAIDFTMTGTLYFGENIMSREYLVFIDKIADIASRYNLKLTEWKSFEEYYDDTSVKITSDDCRDASFLNNTFIFTRLEDACYF
jgi:mRNA (guanine-N7-)-methyltransferase